MAELDRADAATSASSSGWYRHLARWLSALQAPEPRSADELRARLHQQLFAAEAALEAKRKRLGWLEQTMDRLSEERRELGAALEALEQAADAALVEASEDRARSALRQRSTKSRELERVENRLRSLDSERLALAGLLEDQQRRLDALRRDSGDSCPLPQATGGARPSDHGTKDPLDEEELELEMLRRKRSIRDRTREQEALPDATNGL